MPVARLLRWSCRVGGAAGSHGRLGHGSRALLSAGERFQKKNLPSKNADFIEKMTIIFSNFEKPKLKKPSEFVFFQ